jgi:hypothetical protein
LLHGAGRLGDGPAPDPGGVVEVEGRQGGQLVGPLVAGVGGVAAHPAQLQLDVPLTAQLVPGLPEVQVGLALPLPERHLHDVLGVAEGEEVARRRHEEQGSSQPGPLSSIVGGGRQVAGQFPHPIAGLAPHHRGEAGRAVRIPQAAAVRIGDEASAVGGVDRLLRMLLGDDLANHPQLERLRTGH